MKSKRQRYFHYTDRLALAGIMKDGYIRPSCIPGEDGLHVVWVSSNTTWEPIASASYRLNIQDHASCNSLCLDHAYKAIRVEIRGEHVHEWSEVLERNGVSPMDVFVLAQTGYEFNSNPNEWFVVIGPIPMCWCIHIQVWSGTSWVELPEEEYIQRL